MSGAFTSVLEQKESAGTPWQSAVTLWQSALLDHEATLRGNVAAKLFASITGTHAAWIVNLIDVYPHEAPSPELRARQLTIADEVFRAKIPFQF